MTTRRDFLKTSSLAAVALHGMTPSLLVAGQTSALATPFGAPISLDAHPQYNDPRTRELAAIAIDAARSAGATYAEVRLTLDRYQVLRYTTIPPADTETVCAGVRALVNGSWGFVSSAIWNNDEMARLGRAAVEQARANTWAGVPPVHFDPPPEIPTGEWVTPINRDPFDVPVGEKMDMLNSISSYAQSFHNAYCGASIAFRRQDKTFASTDGAMCSQRLYTALDAGTGFSLSVSDPITYRSATLPIRPIGPMSAGYEAFDVQSVLSVIPELYERAREQLAAPAVENARYDLVLDAAAMATILSESIGVAAELDRAMGYEADASGTSYLGPIDDSLGKPVASPLLTVMANRSELGGAATVQWDDEGIAPRDFTIVQDGALVDFSTNRELASTLNTWYASKNIPTGSRGCAAADDAKGFPMIRTPNLRMQADSDNATFEQLVARAENGIAIMGGSCNLDQQKRVGQGFGDTMYRIVNGKLGPQINGVAYLFRSNDFWRKLIAIGGESTRERIGLGTVKGQPTQVSRHSVSAVAAVVRSQIVVDVRTRNILPTP